MPDLIEEFDNALIVTTKDGTTQVPNTPQNRLKYKHKCHTLFQNKEEFHVSSDPLFTIQKYNSSYRVWFKDEQSYLTIRDKTDLNKLFRIVDLYEAGNTDHAIEQMEIFEQVLLDEAQEALLDL